MIVWFTGNSGAGKTTLAEAVQKVCVHSILLDGDVMRDSISLGAGFSKEAREEHNLRVARLAQVLSDQNFLVLVAVIAPFQDARDKISEICDPLWVYLKRRLPVDSEKPYQEPSGILVIDVDEYIGRLDDEVDVAVKHIYANIDRN